MVNRHVVSAMIVTGQKMLLNHFARLHGLELKFKLRTPSS